MNKHLLGFLVLGVLVASDAVYAVKPTAEDIAANQAERNAKKEEMIADKKEAIADKKEDIAQKKVNKICERITNTIDRIQSRVQNREEAALGKMEQRRAQVQEKRTMQNKELEERRMQRDQQREQFYAEMMNKAQTDEQVAAVEKFKETVEAAVQKRRDAIDAATEQMRTNTDVLVDERIGSASDLYTSYQENEATILAKAESYCTDESTEEDLKNIAKDINDELRSAQEKYKKGVIEQKKISAEVQAIAQVRKRAVQLAIDDFTSSVNQARMELRKAFELEDVDSDDSVEDLQE